MFTLAQFDCVCRILNYYIQAKCSLMTQMHTYTTHIYGEGSFWLIWFINQRALCNHTLSIVLHHGQCQCQHRHCLCTVLLATWLGTETSYLL